MPEMVENLRKWHELVNFNIISKNGHKQWKMLEIFPYLSPRVYLCNGPLCYFRKVVVMMQILYNERV